MKGNLGKTRKKIQEEVKPVKKVENNFTGAANCEISQPLQNFATLEKLQGCCASAAFLYFLLLLSDL